MEGTQLTQIQRHLTQLLSDGTSEGEDTERRGEEGNNEWVNGLQFEEGGEGVI